MSVPEADLALIDEFSGGNRTSFMLTASLERARALRRKAIDEEIIQGFADNPEAELIAEWDGAIGEGLEEDALVVTRRGVKPGL